MSEDDDGKTVFQPSKRKDIQKADGRIKNLPEKDPLEKESKEIDASQKEHKKTPAMQFNVGDVLNNVYEIKRFIAKGGMGEVYEAVNVHNTDERVAIKVMLPEFAADERVIAMFAKEAGTLTRLHHEAIVPYRLSSRDELGRPFIVTAYVDGPSLEDQFKEFSPTEEELDRLTRRLAEGLGKAHSFGAIHRDIAPDNVLLVDGNPGLPKIIDFGIAQDARVENKGATIIGDGFAGKLNYVAPEQLGEYGRNIGPWTDIYSLALTMLAVATQKHADMGGSIASAVKKRMTVPDISSIPPRFRRAFKAALQPDPIDRPQSMAAFIKLLDSPVETEKLSSFAPLNSDAKENAKPNVTETLEKPNGAGKGKLVGAAIGAVLLLGVVSAFVMTRGDSPDTVPIEDVVEVDPSAPDVKPPVAQRLTSVMIEGVLSEMRCSWLDLDDEAGLATFDPSIDSIRMFGGTENVLSAQSSIKRSLSRGIEQDINVDVSQVAKFDPALCNVIEILRDIKSPTPLIFSKETARVFEAKKERVDDGKGGFEEVTYVKTKVEVANIDQNKFISVMSVDPRGLLVPLANGREQIQLLTDLFGGGITEDGFALSVPTTPESRQREGYGFVVITGNDEFPQTFFTDTNKDSGYPLTQSWMNQFKALARTKDWTADIFWYSVVDEIDD